MQMNKSVEELKKLVSDLHKSMIAAAQDECSFSVDFWKDLYLEAVEDLENHPDY
jgi:hypothetical protein